MRVSLSLRLFLVHLVFTLGAAALTVFLIVRSFERYSATWERKVAALLPAELYRPLVNEVARSLLLGQEAEYPEVRERRRGEITAGLRAVLRGIPSIRSVVVVDTDLRIQFASEEEASDLAYRAAADREFLESRIQRFRTVELPGGESAEESVIPVFADPEAGGGPGRRRLGSVLVRYRPDPSLLARVSGEQTPHIPPRDYVLPLLVFLAAAAAGGVFVAAVTGLPVRRLDRALAELRARNFRGGLDAKGLGLEGELASAVQAINEMGGRLEALDARGREREALLEKLSASLEEGMIALGSDEVPMAWNDAALRLLNGSNGDGPAAAAIEAGLRINPDLLAFARAHPSGGSGEMDLRRGRGETISARVTVVPFEVQPGELGSLVLIRDLAALRSIEGHLLEADRFAVLAHLAAGLAHEIRNPLHSIGLNATVVEQYLDAPATVERRTVMTDSLVTIREETQRLAQLLNGYLGLVHPDSAQGAVRLEDICGRVVQLLGFTARRSHVEIRLDLAPGLPPVVGVAGSLQQAVLNLVLNAIQAMPHGGVVHLGARASGGIVRITVRDTGPGVPRDLAAHLFETRVTTKPGGTGIGLPLVRMIAEAHGGSVAHRSKPGEGAAFTLILPAGPSA